MRKLKKQIDQLANNVSKVVPSQFNHSIIKSLKIIGISIKYFANEPYQALLTWDHNDQCPIIAVNARDSHQNMNFSMAHELGHLIINYRWLPFNDLKSMPNLDSLPNEYCGKSHYSKKEQKNENIMDEFASVYLLPDSTLKQTINNQQSYLNNISNLSNKFNVPENIAKARLDDYLLSTNNKSEETK